MVRAFIIFSVAFVFIVEANYYDYAAGMRKMTIERFRIYTQRLDTTKLPIDVQKRLEDPSNLPLSIAVTGESGVGKSTLVNTFRNLSADDVDAAPVGIVEKTFEILQHIDPKYSEFIYWDLPGCDLINEEHDHPKRNSTEVLDEIRNDCMKNLNDDQQKKVPIYLISALLSDNNNWDLAKLGNDSIRKNLRLKEELLIHQLTSFSQSEIKGKANLMRSRIFRHSLIATFIPERTSTG